MLLIAAAECALLLDKDNESAGEEGRNKQARREE